MSAEQRTKEWEQWHQIVAKAQQDAGFKKRLLAEPAAVVKEHGLDVPPGVELRMVESPDHGLVLSFLPEGEGRELTEEDLSTVAGGDPCTGYADALGGDGGYPVTVRNTTSWYISW